MKAAGREKLLLNFIQSAAESSLNEMMDLFALGANVDWQHPETRMTALHAAAQAGNLSCVEFLLQNNASLSLTDVAGLTPLETVTNLAIKAKNARPDDGGEDAASYVAQLCVIQARLERFGGAGGSGGVTLRPRKNTGVLQTAPIAHTSASGDNVFEQSGF
jgi:hypothetical protein